MKLIQLNIWQGRLMLNVLRFLKDAQPDILCLQEVCDSPEGRSSYYDNLQDIQKRMDYPYLCYAPTVDWMHGTLNVSFGNAVLSRYPIEQKAVVFTHGARAHNISFEKFGERNFNFQHVILTAPDGGRTHIVNHHGYWFDGPKTGNAESLQKMDKVADYIAALEGPVILTGDLNLSPDAPSLARLNREMENLCLTHKITTTRNFTSFNPVDVCDYIFVRGVTAQSFRVHDDVISDHAALEMVF